MHEDCSTHTKTTKKNEMTNQDPDNIEFTQTNDIKVTTTEYAIRCKNGQLPDMTGIPDEVQGAIRTAMQSVPTGLYNPQSNPGLFNPPNNMNSQTDFQWSTNANRNPFRQPENVFTNMYSPGNQDSVNEDNENSENNQRTNGIGTFNSESSNTRPKHENGTANPTGATGTDCAGKKQCFVRDMALLPIDVQDIILESAYYAILGKRPPLHGPMHTNCNRRRKGPIEKNVRIFAFTRNKRCNICGATNDRWHNYIEIFSCGHVEIRCSFNPGKLYSQYPTILDDEAVQLIMRVFPDPTVLPDNLKNTPE